MKPQERKPREVDVPDPFDEPNAEDLRQNSRHKGTFEDAIRALMAPVRSRRVMPCKRMR